jgi:hypothetical protein
MKTLAIALVLAAAVVSSAGAATQTLTLTSNATVVTYGKTATLSGQLAPAKANQAIGVGASLCGATKATKVATAKTAASGAYSSTVTPTGATKYQASYKNVTSPVVTVDVKPVLELSKAAGSWGAKVTAGQSLTGKAVLFQRYSKLRKRWVQVKRVLLTTATPGTTKPTTITTASFKATVVRGARVRLLLTTAQAAPCYVTATSATLRA